MEWVETTAKTVELAREAALDQLGVAGDEAEFDVVEEPRPGLFGRVRGQARVRARVRPTPVRPKQERRRKGRDKSRATSSATGVSARTEARAADDGEAGGEPSSDPTPTREPAGTSRSRARGGGGREHRGDKRNRSGGSGRTTDKQTDDNQEQAMDDDRERQESTVTPEEVGDAAVTFVSGLTDAFGFDATTEIEIDDIELAVSVTGTELGLLVGPGGRTLTAVQDLTRVAAQRRLGDHETRLRVDVAGYRERRNAALVDFALKVAQSVRETGSARSLEPMSSADRKVIHDVLNDQEGVASHSEGEDPSRRVVVTPA